jgi:glycosyltransferase involved in cell wall biosynthesis
MAMPQRTEVSADPHELQTGLKVFVLVNRLFEWSQNFITRELRTLSELGVEMTIGARTVLDRPDLDERERQLMRLFHRIPDNPFLPAPLYRHLRYALRYPRYYRRAWGMLFSLRHRLRKFPRGVICLFRAASMGAYVRNNGYNLLHAHFLTAPGETALYLSALTGIPFGATAYAMDIYVDNSGLAGKLKAAAYVNGTTRFNELYLGALVPSAAQRFVTRYYGIPVSERPPEPISHGGFRFLAVGRLVPKKGFEYLVEACRLLAAKGLAFECEIIGTGPEEAVLREGIRAAGLEDRFRVTGYVPPNELPDRYRRSDVLVAPCIVAANGDVDGLPNVCLEAMNAGLPVISTTVSGIPEGVEDGVNGWLVPPADARALAAAMEKALLSENQLPAMRAASHRMVRQKFDVRKNVPLIRDLMETHRKR